MERLDQDGCATAGHMPWHRRTLVGFDLETTGTDPLSARVVSASIVRLPPGGEPLAGREWLVDPAVPIPPEASAVHGITDEQVRAIGMPPGRAIPEILDVLETSWRAGEPIVVFNASYDLTLIDAEARRHGVRPLTARVGFDGAVVIDPLVVDRYVDRYRRGRRTLCAMAEHYGVPLRDAHRSEADALAACRLARALAATFPEVARADGAELHRSQCRWHRAWAARFEDYLHSVGRSDAVICGAWPVIEEVPGIGDR